MPVSIKVRPSCAATPASTCNHRFSGLVQRVLSQQFF
jgi:hypothetical protein